MENVCIPLHMEAKNVVIWYGGRFKEVNREHLLKFLVVKSVKNISRKWFYNSALKAVYHDAFDFIIRHFDEIDCIQIYQDNAIHIYSDERHFTKLFVFEDYDFCSNEKNAKLLKELLFFANFD